MDYCPLLQLNPNDFKGKVGLLYFKLKHRESIWVAKSLSPSNRIHTLQRSIATGKIRRDLIPKALVERMTEYDEILVGFKPCTRDDIDEQHEDAQYELKCAGTLGQRTRDCAKSPYGFLAVTHPSCMDMIYYIMYRRGVGRSRAVLSFQHRVKILSGSKRYYAPGTLGEFVKGKPGSFLRRFRATTLDVREVLGSQAAREQVALLSEAAKRAGKLVLNSR